MESGGRQHLYVSIYIYIYVCIYQKDEGPSTNDATNSSSSALISLTSHQDPSVVYPSPSMVTRAFGEGVEESCPADTSVNPNHIMGCSSFNNNQETGMTDDHNSPSSPIQEMEQETITPIDKSVIPTDKLQALLIAAIGLYQEDYDVADNIISKTIVGYTSMKAGLKSNWTLDRESSNHQQ